MSAEQTVKQKLANAFRKSETLTASELADILERDAKVVRAYLRSAKLRDQSTLKNQRWVIDREVADAAAQHFDSAKRVAASE